MPMHLEGTCSICGNKRGECQLVSDASNFIIPAWSVWEEIDGVQVEKLTHEIPPDTPLIFAFKATIPANCRIRLREECSPTS